jgi:hypothetical protein
VRRRPPEAWRALGFRVEDGSLDLGGIRIRLDEERAGGIVSWSLRGVNAMGSIDGLPSPVSRVLRPPPFATHPNGATGLDHVVVATPDFNRTADAFRRAGMPLRRIRESGDLRQGFRRLGEVRPAVQPGRRIVTLQPADGVSARLAFMSPEAP